MLHCSEDCAVESTWEFLQTFSSDIYRKNNAPGLCIGTLVSSITLGDISEFSAANISKRASRQTTKTGIKYFSISSHSSTYMEITICLTQILSKLPTIQYLKGAQYKKGRGYCSDRTRGNWKRTDLDWILELNSLLWRCWGPTTDCPEKLWLSISEIVHARPGWTGLGGLWEGVPSHGRGWN